MYKILNIENSMETEPLGTKEKFWCEHEGRKYLFKIGRENTGENWAEKVACELGKLLGLPVAEYEFAQYKERYGVVSLSVSNNDSLIHGNSVLTKLVDDYDGTKRYHHKEYKLATVLDFINTQSATSIHNFVGYLVFDCFISNQDRHHENWAFIQNGEISLAPSYDHASSLGCRVSEQEAESRLTGKDKRYTILSFCEKGKSPFYGEDKQLYLIDVCRNVRSFNKQSFAYWANRINALQESDIRDIFGQMPSEFHTNSCAFSFAEELLKTNKMRLMELANG